RLAALAKQYASKDVVFLGLDANRQDSVTKIAAYARHHEIDFPILKDLNQTIADKVGATRTPEGLVLDRKHEIRYRGRIDDQYGFQSNKSYTKPSATESSLAGAIDAVLAGKPVAAPQTQVAGCLIGRDAKADSASDVTYCNQIVRILNANCVF